MTEIKRLPPSFTPDRQAYLVKDALRNKGNEQQHFTQALKVLIGTRGHFETREELEQVIQKEIFKNKTLPKKLNAEIHARLESKVAEVVIKFNGDDKKSEKVLQVFYAYDPKTRLRYYEGVGLLDPS